jgi:uncharacterized membrane protein HdeD (DUF308 family)
MLMEILARNWWMIAVRGALAIGFGVALLAWPAVTLSIVVVLFGAYAILDGVWTLLSILAVPKHLFARTTVALDGLVSLALGGLALAWPYVPREFIQLVALWGVLTGILEVLAAASIPRERVGHWLMGTAGVSSMFLAVLVLMLPEASVASAVYVIGGYALVFGVALTASAAWFRATYRPTAPATLARARAA